MPSAIHDYALIGDCETAALVARDGSVDFLCWPRFDSDACFAALVGEDRHGHWRLAPSDPAARISRHYEGDTLVLATRYETPTGCARTLDFMPFRGRHSSLIRIVDGVEGSVEFLMTLALRFEYGVAVPWTRLHERGALFELGPRLVVLDSAAEIEIRDHAIRSSFTVASGQRRVFSLTYGEAVEALPPRPDAQACLEDTRRRWNAWIARFDRPCRWPGPVRRSLVTLKALTHRQTGGLIAAASLGLPETPGGAMNWDYRYCWLRDATFTLTALLNAGYTEEAGRWQDWIERAIGGDPASLQIVYRLDGQRRLTESEAGWLPGFEGARPVLIGNSAAEQVQLDVTGELLDGFHVARRGGIERSERGIAIERALVEQLERSWDRPGADIWESRGEKRRYTYSQALCAAGIAQFLEAPGTRDAVGADEHARLETLRDRILATVDERGFDRSRGHFVKHYGGGELDASLLLLPILGVIRADDERMIGTVRAIERELMEDGLVRRKKASGDGPEEGAFLACSCWLADVYWLQGRQDDAAALLERVIGVANDVGLLAEEYHVPSRRLVGNFPQALSHLALVDSALLQSGPVIRHGPRREGGHGPRGGS